MANVANQTPGHALRTVLTVWGVGVMLLGAAPASATHFRYGNLSAQPAGGRTINFHLTDAFRRSASPSFDPCVSPANINTIVACTGPGGTFCASGGNVGNSCTTNASCGSGSICSPLHGVGDVIREDIGGTQLQFGDGSHTPPGSTPLVYVVTSIDTANNWSFVEALDPATLPAINTAIAHTYGGSGTTFTAKVDDCCRIQSNVPPNGHINNPNKAFLLSTTIDFTGNNCPVSSQLPIVTCPINALCTFSVPASDANGDPLRWRLASAGEASSDNDFVQPGPPNAPNAAGITAGTGLYTWNTAGATLAGGGLNTLYSTQVLIEDLTGPGGAVKCRTPVDFMIQLVPQVNHPPTCSAPAAQTVLAGTNVSFTVSGSDVDGGDTVTLTGAGLPAGSSMTPPLPATGNPVSSQFSWTPTATDFGPFVVQFAATDQVNQQALCSTTITVQCNAPLCGDGNGCTDDTCGANGCAHTPNTSLVCRAASGACDVAESCDASGSCPPDIVAPSGFVCGAGSGDACDPDETCDGVAAACPTDVVATPATVCRAAVGACDAEEHCSGVAAVPCPADQKQPTTAECRGAVDACDVAEACDGASDTCPTDGKRPDGAPCSDGLFCDGEETCQSAVCTAGTPPCIFDGICNEVLDRCVTDGCPTGPQSGCRTAQKGTLLLKNKTDDNKDKLIWKFIRGAATTTAEFADPMTSADYALCIYAGTAEALVATLAVPHDGNNWRALNDRGFRYSDLTMAGDGVRKMKLKRGTADRTKAFVKGRGLLLPDPLDAGALDLPVRAQLYNYGTGICWETNFTSATKNSTVLFRAKQ